MSGMKSKRVGPDLGVNYHNRVKVISGEASAQIAAKAIVRVSGLDNGLKKVTLATAADGAREVRRPALSSLEARNSVQGLFGQGIAGHGRPFRGVPHHQ